MTVKFQPVASAIAAFAIALGAVATLGRPSAAQTTTYFCQRDHQGIFTTYAQTLTGREIAVIRWVRDWGGEYTNESRCREVSQRFQKAYDRGILNFMTSGVMNGQRVICATSEYGQRCLQLLLTLGQEDDPNQAIEQLIGIGYRAEGPLMQAKDGSPRYYYDMELLHRNAPTE